MFPICPMFYLLQDGCSYSLVYLGPTLGHWEAHGLGTDRSQVLVAGARDPTWVAVQETVFGYHKKETLLLGVCIHIMVTFKYHNPKALKTEILLFFSPKTISCRVCRYFEP